jgi:hypothetical protein
MCGMQGGDVKREFLAADVRALFALFDAPTSPDQLPPSLAPFWSAACHKETTRQLLLCPVASCIRCFAGLEVRLAAVARHESKKLGELLRHPDVEAAISSGGELIEALVTMCSFGALNLRNIVCHGFCFDLPDALVVLAAHLCTSATALIPREPVMVTELSEPYWEEITFSREFPMLFERLPRLEHGLREAWMLLNCDFDDHGHVGVFCCCCCCCFFFLFLLLDRTPPWFCAR